MDRAARRALPASTLASVALHAGILALLWQAPPPRRWETLKIDVVESAPPAPAPPPLPPPRPLEAAPRPRLVEPKVATALPRDAAERREPEPAAPPPPNAPPPAGAAPAPGVPIKIGVSLSSTTSSGGFAAPVGNTLYGELPKIAPKPEEVKPYAAEKVVPPTQVTVLPRPLAVEVGKEDYPPEALAQGLEGRVVLRLLVDETGKVVEAIVVDDPGHGFGAAAARAARRFRYEPARRGDERVATWLRITVAFEAQ